MISIHDPNKGNSADEERALLNLGGLCCTSLVLSIRFRDLREDRVFQIERFSFSGSPKLLQHNALAIKRDKRQYLSVCYEVNQICIVKNDFTEF